MRSCQCHLVLFLPTQMTTKMTTTATTKRWVRMTAGSVGRVGEHPWHHLLLLFHPTIIINPTTPTSSIPFMVIIIIAIVGFLWLRAVQKRWIMYITRKTKLTVFLVDPFLCCIEHDNLKPLGIPTNSLIAFLEVPSFLLRTKNNSIASRCRRNDSI